MKKFATVAKVRIISKENHQQKISGLKLLFVNVDTLTKSTNGELIKVERRVTDISVGIKLLTEKRVFILKMV